MTIKQLEFINKILVSIKPPDEQILKAIAYINKDLAQYAACRGQLKDSYERDSGF